MPAPTLLAYLVGMKLLGAGFGLLIRRTIRIAAATAGTVLLLLTVCFYAPIFGMEITLRSGWKESTTWAIPCCSQRRLCWRALARMDGVLPLPSN